MPKFNHGTHLNSVKTKGGRRKSRYIRFSAGPLRGKYVHRVIVEARIGRPLTEWETVDHKDGDTLNDAPANLSDPMSWEEHGLIEAARRRDKAERKRKARQDRREKKERDTDFNFGANKGSEEQDAD
jgi:hypothetical protein